MLISLANSFWSIWREGSERVFDGLEIGGYLDFLFWDNGKFCQSSFNVVDFVDSFHI